MADYLDLMTRFRKAYATADRDALAAVFGVEFEWHTHTFSPSDPVPTGRVIRGIDDMVKELEWRKENWVGVRFEGLQERFAPGLVTQTFTISGVDRGTPFHVDAVDLYTLDANELITKKDTYWKHAAP